MKARLFPLGAILGAVLALAPFSSGAQELGRLFFTPDQRAALDARRKARVPDKPAATPQAEQPTTRLDGAVQRSGGKSTVWINGEPVQESPKGDRARLQARDKASIPLGESEARRELRVGETLDRGTGEVRDVVGKDAVKVKPSGGAPAK